MSSRELQAKLEEILDPELIIVEPELCAAYEVDGKRPTAVARPADPAAVGRVLTLSAREHWATIPWGGGTQMGCGNVPRAYDLALDLVGLDQVYEYDVENRVLTAGAGCTLKMLHDLAIERRQFLPFDPPLAENATLGGTIAAGALGSHRRRYGSDHVLGLEVALVSGQVIRFGPSGTAGAAGYDFARLFYGSFGTLGVITQVTCRLLPTPGQTRGLLAGFAGAAEAFGVAGELRASRLQPTHVDLIEGSPLKPRDDTTLSLFVSFDGTSEGVEHEVREFYALVELGRATFVEELDSAAGESFVRKMRDLPASTEAPAVVRIGLAPSGLADFWQRSARPAEADDAHGPITLFPARAGVGEVYAFLKAPDEALPGLIAGLQTAAGELNGHAVIERLPAALKADLDVWGPHRQDDPDWPLTQALKADFDPDGVLCPGRYVGRL